MVGLYASFCIAVTISIVGGRMGMISAATGAMASLMGPIVATLSSLRNYFITRQSRFF
ncbi:hypothetical protein PASE110613_04825 [Paenibacillus sediminis]|uniref:MFS superfamily sulfate permease-like transporter n=1 Tax=Paenibacillus sediminis TaxID=664909 RepID=A0ABS4H0V0_9BACL|nr:MFS superfamily sulfate permease-like transporter [Paenibacillus sediminis]